MLKFIKQMDALKAALESVDVFHEKSILFARLEAEALIRCVELGGINKLYGHRRSTAKWLASLSSEGRERFINMCSEGFTIENIYRREIEPSIKLDMFMKEISESRDSLIAEVREYGIVDTRPFIEKVNSKLIPEHKSLANDIVDGLRHRLRQAGAVGIEDSHIYVLPTAQNKDEVKEAILTRYKSIEHDFARIKEIAQKSGIQMSFKEFHSSFGFQDCTSKGYIPHILCAFDRINLISDPDEMYEAIEKTEFKMEMELAAKNLKVARDQIVRWEYAQLQKETEA